MSIKGLLMPGVILGIAIGLAIEVGTYTFVYARGYSYMTDNAEACVNCHIMQDQFSGWVKSSHRAVAVCNNCHTPPGVVAKKRKTHRKAPSSVRGLRWAVQIVSTNTDSPFSKRSIRRATCWPSSLVQSLSLSSTSTVAPLRLIS